MKSQTKDVSDYKTGVQVLQQEGNTNECVLLEGSTGGVNDLSWNTHTRELYVADSEHDCIRVIKEDQSIVTIGGSSDTQDSDTQATSVVHHRDGSYTDARFNCPTGVDCASDGSVYVADMQNHCIRRIKDNQVTTIAGKPMHKGYKDLKGQSARFNNPIGVSWDNDAKALYVADSGNHCIRGCPESALSETVETVRPDASMGVNRDTLKLARAKTTGVDLAFSMIWEEAFDLDLFVKDPWGDLVWYFHEQTPSGGKLDLQMNTSTKDGLRREVLQTTVDHMPSLSAKKTVWRDGKLVDGLASAVNNVHWVQGTAPAGQYSVYVRCYATHKYPTKYTSKCLEEGLPEGRYAVRQQPIAFKMVLTIDDRDVPINNKDTPSITIISPQESDGSWMTIPDGKSHLLFTLDHAFTHYYQAVSDTLQICDPATNSVSHREVCLVGSILQVCDRKRKRRIAKEPPRWDPADVDRKMMKDIGANLPDKKKKCLGGAGVGTSTDARTEQGSS
jgi:hypothetical protein